MKIFRKYYLYALSFCMVAFMILLPIRVEASSGNISFSGEIQSVSAGNEQTYSLRILNEDYTAVATSNVLPNSILDVSTYFTYTPSYDTSTEVLSFTLLEQEINISNSNWIEFNLPINISSSSSYVKISDYNLWVLLNGNKYYLGKGPITSKIRYDLGNSFGYFVFGVDIQVNCTQSKDFSSDMVIDGQLINGTLNGTYYDSSGKYYSDFSADPNFLINESYIDQIIENRASYSGISISWDDASYLCGYIQTEDVSLLTDILAWIKNVYLNISDSNSWLSSIYNNISTSNSWFNNIYNRIGDYGELIIDKLTELTTGYQGAGTTEADSKFNTGADELTSIEENLSDSSNSFVNDFTTNGFDVSVLTTVGSSMTFIVTWFTNFWNMGGILTSGLNICFAIAIAFFILRVKR